MAIARTVLIGAVVLFGVIGITSVLKKKSAVSQIQQSQLVQEVPLKVEPLKQTVPEPVAPPIAAVGKVEEEAPVVDRIPQLFALDSSKLPIVETIAYSSRVPWLKGRPAWIADYASHYETSRHFIARSLNRKADYFTQKISLGDRFNVFKRDKHLKFHLLIDLTRCKMFFYYYDVDSNERVLLKTYKVGLGRLDAKRPSGCLTPLGTYELGDKIAIYKPGTQGFFQDQKVEMIRIFGTRWIPFGKELEGCSESAKGFGLHGAPWSIDAASGALAEDRSKIGKYDSDGCIRLSSEDIEELFSIIITKPTTVHLVTDVHEARLPGVERKL